MADLEFVDQHNMVTCLEKTEGNSEFHEIVDFLTSSSIHALTVSPTIYTSYIETHFGSTAVHQTVMRRSSFKLLDESQVVLRAPR
ncbi:hypothetical protein Tco_0532031 [Tanacetum coccineum]